MLNVLSFFLFCISALRKHDVVFVVTVRPTHTGPVKYDRTKPFREQVLLFRIIHGYYKLSMTG